MINKNFYPTPHWLVEKMLEKVDFKYINSVLEPSSGKGDIVDIFVETAKRRDYRNYEYKTSRCVDCIEIEPELQATLKGKGYRVVHNDFLTFNTHKHYDLIIMNPPFDEGDKHLLKALDMQKDGGAIISLLNAETLKNPYSNERKDLVQKLNEYNAKIEYIENAFCDAERTTGVEVALVRVVVPEKERHCELINKLRQEEKEHDLYDHSCKELTKFASENDYIELAIEQYNTEIKLGEKLINDYLDMLPYIKNKIKREDDKTEGSPILTLLIGSEYSSNRTRANINDFVKSVRYKYWEALFNNPQFTGKLTSNLVSDLHNRLEELSNYDFSMWNIMTIKEEMIKETIKGVEDTILTLFDEFSNKYSWLDETSKNIHYYNGWKTNKAWKINKKVILPHNAFSSWDKSPEINKWGTLGKFTDMIKVFNYLATKNHLDVNVEQVLTANQNRYNTKDIDLGYFTVTFYKKGTCHIVFNDLELLEKFNLFGSQRKGWLPPSFFKKAYTDFSPEEKEVVDEFCGEEMYNRFITEKDYYLAETNKFLMIEG